MSAKLKILKFSNSQLKSFQICVFLTSAKHTNKNMFFEKCLCAFCPYNKNQWGLDANYSSKYLLLCSTEKINSFTKFRTTLGWINDFYNKWVLHELSLIHLTTRTKSKQEIAVHAITSILCWSQCVLNKRGQQHQTEHVYQSNKLACKLNQDLSRQPWLWSRSSECQDTHCCSRTSEGTWCWSQRNPNPAGWPYLPADELVKSVRGCCSPVHFQNTQVESTAMGEWCFHRRLSQNRAPQIR